MFRRVQLKTFFHDKEDDSNTSKKDTFETLQIRKSKWTPPEGQFATLDFFIRKCRHDITFKPQPFLRYCFKCHAELSKMLFSLSITNLITGNLALTTRLKT